MRKLIALLIFCIMFCVADRARADPREDAFAAFHQGKYLDASNQLKPFADRGDVFAQSLLGFLYEKGQGVAQDYREAVKWYRLAAEQENSSSQYNLGWMYQKGYGVAQDDVRAHMWYNLVAASNPSDLNNSSCFDFESSLRIFWRSW